MSLIPIVVPDLPVLWHNAVVDVEPTSQYSLDHDVASVNSTLCYLNESARPLSVTLLAPSDAETECNVRRQSRAQAERQEVEPLQRGDFRAALEALAAGGYPTTPLEAILERSARQYAAQVALEPGRQVVRFHTRVPILRRADGSFDCSLAVPLGAGALRQQALLSVLVLLPGNAPDYQVEVVDWAIEPGATGRVAVYGRESGWLAGRAAVAWQWAGQPFVWVRYRYQG